MTQPDRDKPFLRTLTVLLVEDDGASREMTAVLLRRLVRGVLTARNGEEGLAAFVKDAPDILVTDIQMPGLDGLGLVEEARRLRPGVPVVITTAFEHTDYMIRAIDLGVDRFVLKPIRASRMESALLACAARLRGDEEARERERLESRMERMRRQVATGILMGGVAHDYNNLLQGILAAMDTATLLAGPGTPAADALGIARESAMEARALSRRLLTFTQGLRQDSGVGSPDDVVRNAVQETLRDGPVTLDLRLEGAAAQVRFDPSDLDLVAANLARNARDAMPSGGRVTLTSGLCRLDPGNPEGMPPGGYYRLRVEDTGPGIPADILPSIFDPYFSTKARGTQRGMGLGLALCEAVLRAHRGAIRADGAPGRGAGFLIHLPLVE
jgi:signal transduction histidine kinase